MNFLYIYIADTTTELHNDNSNLMFNLNISLNNSLIIFYGFRESSPWFFYRRQYRDYNKSRSE